jgi:hypothetical protein
MYEKEISPKDFRHSLFVLLRALTGISTQGEIEGRWKSLSNDELFGLILATTKISIKRLEYLERQHKETLQIMETLRQMDLFRRG